MPSQLRTSNRVRAETSRCGLALSVDIVQDSGVGGSRLFTIKCCWVSDNFEYTCLVEKVGGAFSRECASDRDNTV